MDDNGLPVALGDVDLTSASDVEIAQVGLQLVVGRLQIEQSLRGVSILIR